MIKRIFQWTDKDKLCDAAFEGGGVRGIGLVGAVSAFEEAGYKFRNVAGSSAGAIVASLLASGYSAREMHEVLSKMNFEQFKQSTSWKAFGTLGALVSATKNFGMYSSQLFEDWLANLLAAKGVHTFADLPLNLKVTASDVTAQKALVLPDDLAKFGIDGRNFPVATAVRMSMSIPFFYEPYELKDISGNTHYIVDGGMLCNYPVWVFDSGKTEDVPVFGFRFIRHPAVPKRADKTGLVTYAKQVITTMIEAHDDSYQNVISGDLQRTVYIDTKVDGNVIGITDFHITQPQVQLLFENGRSSGTSFLTNWDFKEWKRKFR